MDYRCLRSNIQIMKKVYLPLVALLFILSSCSAIHWQIGQSSDAFLKANHNHNFETVRSSTEWTVYKWINNWSYTDPPYFFYFHYNILQQVDRGKRASDVIIEHR
jgi:hypothetical protein